MLAGASAVAAAAVRRFISLLANDCAHADWCGGAPLWMVFRDQKIRTVTFHDKNTKHKTSKNMLQKILQ
jgi:hypothetical protein